MEACWELGLNKKVPMGKGTGKLLEMALDLGFCLGVLAKDPPEVPPMALDGKQSPGPVQKTTAGIPSHQGGTGALTPQCIVAQQGALWYCPWGPHTRYPGLLQCAIAEQKDPSTHILG